ncbi:MAG: methyltransferase [Actinomycetaceae bacterium]|nr:methyltransferase [Actinomycetaceae bacterium]
MMTERLDLALSEQGWKILQRFGPLPAEDATNLAERMRAKGLDPDLVSAVVTQLQLRWEAQEKLGSFADSMIFTRSGLEQATRLQVAALHAKRFRDAGAISVADLGCGIGVDSMAMAGIGLQVTAIDHDETTLAAAKVNLRFFPNATATMNDVTSLDVDKLGVDAIFADPQRRNAYGRIKDPEQWSPPLSTVTGWKDHVKALGVKVSPAIDYDDIPDDAHAVWTSVDGELVEACLWFGAAASQGAGRSAVVLSSKEGVAPIILHEKTCTNPREAADTVKPVDTLGNYVCEPDAAVIRAGLIPKICDELGGAPVGNNIAYITTSTLPSPLPGYVKAYEVIDHCQLKPKPIRQMLLHLSPLEIEIKKRGVDISPSQLRRQVFRKPKKRSGSEPLVLLCTPTVFGRRAIVARRLG